MIPAIFHRVLNASDGGRFFFLSPISRGALLPIYYRHHQYVITSKESRDSGVGRAMDAASAGALVIAL